ncbi:MAG: hypothetical protein ACTSR3_03675 [Candidatus Helarchaeota archaeon]
MPKNIVICSVGKNLNKVEGQASLHLIMEKFERKNFLITPEKEIIFNFVAVSILKTVSEQIDIERFPYYSMLGFVLLIMFMMKKKPSQNWLNFRIG